MDIRNQVTVQNLLYESANSYVLYLLYVTEWIVLVPRTLVTGRDLSRVGLRASPVVEFVHEANDKKNRRCTNCGE